MSEKDKLRSMVELMNDALRTVRDYYDSEYAYYVERDDEEYSVAERPNQNVIPRSVSKMAERGSYRYHRRQLQCILSDG